MKWDDEKVDARILHAMRLGRSGYFVRKAAKRRVQGDDGYKGGLVGSRKENIGARRPRLGKSSRS